MKLNNVTIMVCLLSSVYADIWLSSMVTRPGGSPANPYKRTPTGLWKPHELGCLCSLAEWTVVTNHGLPIIKGL